MSVPPEPRDRVCDICGVKGPLGLDNVKVYTHEYGAFEGLSHTKCLEKLLRD